MPKCFLGELLHTHQKQFSTFLCFWFFFFPSFWKIAVVVQLSCLSVGKADAS